MTTFAPDGAYLIGPVPDVDRLYLATGCAALGIAGSAAVGRWLAKWVIDGDPGEDLTIFRTNGLGLKSPIRNGCVERANNFTQTTTASAQNSSTPTKRSAMTKYQNDTDETTSTVEPIGRQRAIRVDVPTNLENIRVILFEPREPGNIGSAARALKGMGLSQLYLVNPVPFLEAKPTWYMAHGATDVIENCCVVETLEDALEGIQFLVGTTHRRRAPRLSRSVSAREAAQEIASISQQQQVALLFGREDFGLSTSEISRCQLIASVPMAAKNPSLNLAQAVQIFAYEVFLASAGDIPPTELETRRSQRD